VNITTKLWYVLEISVRDRFPPQTSLKQLEDVKVEWYKIPVDTVHNSYEFIPRRITAILKAKVGPTPY
jgi:hypothetical protein